MELRKKIRAKDLAMTQLDSQCFDDLRRLLSGGTAAEILSGNDDIAFPDLSGQLRPKGAEAVLFHIINGLECQVLGGDDDIRIDIVPQDPDLSGKCMSPSVMYLLPQISALPVAISPAMAEAVTVAAEPKINLGARMAPHVP